MVASRMEWTQEPGPWTGATIDVRRDGARTGDDGPRTSLLLMFVQPFSLDLAGTRRIHTRIRRKSKPKLYINL